MRKLKLKIQMFFGRIMNPFATHVFWFSQQQSNYTKECRYYPFEERENPTFGSKRIEYTEMREFKYGVSNHSDAVIIGFGSFNDVSHNI
jgi:hypothetical protein